MTRIEKGPGWELRLGDFRDVLADVERVDHVICDPPYLGAGNTSGGQPFAELGRNGEHSKPGKSVMRYQAATTQLLRDLVSWTQLRANLWLVVFNDFPGTRVLADEAEARGAIVAEPIGWLKPPSFVSPRGNNLLPRKGTELITVARWRTATAQGRVLPGGYASPVNTAPPYQVIGITGGKPLPLMRDVVRDFTTPGELVCDLTAGEGTTLLAAVIEGRKAIGAEKDPETFESAVARLRAGWTPRLPLVGVGEEEGA